MLVKQQLKKMLCTWGAPFLQRASLPVFLLHGVVPAPGPLFRKPFDGMEPEAFQKQLEFLKKHFDFIFLSEAVALAKSGASLEGKCALTFDDGYACLAEYAFPILEEMNVPTTVFIISDIIDDKNYFWRDHTRYILNNNLVSNFVDFVETECELEAAQRPSQTTFYEWSRDPKGLSSHIIQKLLADYFKKRDFSLPLSDQGECKNLYLTQAQISAAPACIEFGNHTASHPVLPSLSLAEQEKEIASCKTFLDGIERSVPLLCLPFGRYKEETLQAAKNAGYESIVYHNHKGLNVVPSLSEGVIDRYTLPAKEQDLSWMLLKGIARINR